MVSPDDLHGVHVALATPLDDAGQVDDTALVRLIEHVLEGGVNGVCPVGSTGEGPRLTLEVRRMVTASVRAAVPEAIPVVAAPAALNADDIVTEIEELAGAGADAVLVAPPSYYPMASDDVARFYEYVAGRAAVPLVIYNIPMMTKVTVPAATVGMLAEHPNVIGIKDSSRDFEYLEAVVYASTGQEFAVLSGSDTMLFASLLVGAAGAIAASANLVPQLSRSVYDSARAGDLEKAAIAQRELFDVIQACRVGITPAGWKAALALAGICGPVTVPPAQPLTESQRSALGTRLKELGVL